MSGEEHIDKLTQLLHDIQKQKENLSSDADTLMEITPHKSRVNLLEQKILESEIRNSQIILALEHRIRALEGKIEKCVTKDSDNEEEIEEENFDDELASREKLIQNLQDQLRKQQQTFRDTLTKTENTIKEVIHQTKASAHPKRVVSFHSGEKSSPVAVRKEQSPLRSLASRIEDRPSNPKANVPYPPGYNPNKRRFSVSAEPPSSVPTNPDSLLKKVIPKSASTRQRIKSIIVNNILFKQLEDEELEKCLDIMFEKRLAVGEVIIQQGDDGDNFYVIDSGELDVIKDGKLVNVLGQGRSFGEIALMYNVPRIATVKARTNSVCWGMDRISFRVLLMEHAKKKRELYQQFLEKVPIFSSLEGYERSIIADALEPMNFEDGDFVIRQGEKGDRFYIVEEGEAVVTQSRSIHGAGKPVEVMRLTRGQYFGEVALITNKPRAANVVAVGELKCLTMTRRDFEQLMGPCEQIIKRNMGQYKSIEEIIASSNN